MFCQRVHHFFTDFTCASLFICLAQPTSTPSTRYPCLTTHWSEKQGQSWACLGLLNTRSTSSWMQKKQDSMKHTHTQKLNRGQSSNKATMIGPYQLLRSQTSERKPHSPVSVLHLRSSSCFVWLFSRRRLFQHLDSFPSIQRVQPKTTKSSQKEKAKMTRETKTQTGVKKNKPDIASLPRQLFLGKELYQLRKVGAIFLQWVCRARQRLHQDSLLSQL